jgi:endonuclease/exonuclease/phosphatase family metal-dependent hydrolase
LTDAWGPGNGPDRGTYGGWKAPEAGGHRIDWILTRGIEVADADICDYHADLQWPSDHVPAWADLLL